LKTYRKPEDHPRVSKEELAYINCDSEPEAPSGTIPWLKIITKRETLAFALTTITDAVWWFYLFWGAKFLFDQFSVDIDGMGLPFLVIFILADAGSLLGGLASGALIRKGWTINKARKITMLVNAIIILPVALVPIVSSKWIAVFLIGIGAMGHQSWSITSYTLVPDVFPKKAVASVIGVGKMVGVFTAIIADLVLGAVLDTAGNSGYFWAFVISGMSYLVIIGFVHMLMPHMTPLDDKLQYIRK
jgi:ACS family hexuronate transporter-like MFS transporter